jgi:hypothetical protein
MSGALSAIVIKTDGSLGKDNLDLLKGEEHEQF